MAHDVLGGMDVIYAHIVGIEAFGRATVNKHHRDAGLPNLLEGGDVFGATEVPEDDTGDVPIFKHALKKEPFCAADGGPIRLDGGFRNQPKVGFVERLADAAHDHGIGGVAGSGPKPKADVETSCSGAGRRRGCRSGSLNDRPTLRRTHEQPALFEFMNGGAHDDAADAELLGDFAFCRQPLAGKVNTGTYTIFQSVRNM